MSLTVILISIKSGMLSSVMTHELCNRNIGNITLLSTSFSTTSFKNRAYSPYFQDSSCQLENSLTQSN